MILLVTEKLNGALFFLPKYQICFLLNTTNPPLAMSVDTSKYLVNTINCLLQEIISWGVPSSDGHPGLSDS